MPTGSAPSLEAFLSAPIAQVRAVAPTTMIYGPGGTRRKAVLEGFAPDSEEYVQWSRARMVETIGEIFNLGVKHLFLTVLQSTQLAEVGRYRDRLVDWVDWVVAGPEAIADYQAHGWRARLVGAEALPEVAPAVERLRSETAGDAEHTVWFYVNTTSEDYWATLLRVSQEHGARTQAEAIRAIYGEDIPPADLCLSFGKLIVSPDIFPPLLAGSMQCYWTQAPGVELSEMDLRRIFYDYAYLRRTWMADKSGRYSVMDEQRELWARGDVLGLGERVGPFWYPVLPNVPSISEP